LSEKEDFQISDETERLINSYKEEWLYIDRTKSEAKFHVSQILSPLAFFYERIRNALDYKGDHLMRRNAIERILRRQIWEKRTGNPSVLSETLLKELIWARYEKNDYVPKKKIQILEVVVRKYLKIFQRLETVKSEKGLQECKDWFMGVFSSEVEELLEPSIFLKESLNYEVFSWFKENYDWQEHNLSDKDRDIQIFIAIHRSLTKSDKAGVRYRLLKVYYPNWDEIDDIEIMKSFASLINLIDEIEEKLNSLYQPRLFRFIQRQLPAFLILKEMIDEDFEEAEKIFQSPKKLENKITEVCNKKYSQIGTRIRTGIIRSIIYIFMTKALLALMIEIPYELFVTKDLNFASLSINVLFPPTLMFLVGMTIRKPGDENTQRIIQIIKSFVYEHKKTGRYEFSLERKKLGGLVSQIFLVLYLLMFLITFGGIGLILLDLGFNLLSAGMFFIFLSLVLLFVYRVRYTATELNVQGEREGFLSHLFSNFTIPLLNLGQVISNGFRKLNFILLFMDFLIEVPLKSIIAIFEEWSMFMREKREEVIEIPN